MTDEKKKPEEELSDGQLDDVAGGSNEPSPGSILGGVLNSRKQVEVYRAGGTYNGTYYVDEVEHSIESAGYEQRFKLKRNEMGAT